MFSTNPSLWTGVALVTALSPAAAQSSPLAGEAPSAVLSGLSISFKLDRHVVDITYGELWLSGPSFTSTVQTGTVGVVDVRVGGRDARGAPVRVVPEWTVDDPELVTVTPIHGDEFRITAKRAGQSRLTVAAQGVSTELLVKASNLGEAMQVEISQEAATGNAPIAGGARDPGDAGLASGGSVLPDGKARNSYALGLEMGRRLEKMSLELDAELVSQAVLDALMGNPTLLTDEETRAALTELRRDLQGKREEPRRELARRNAEAGEAFLAENEAREGVVTLESGLQYRVLRAGDGAKPTTEDRVVCQYRGTLVDGMRFDSSYDRRKPATFALKRVIKGWAEALQLMPVGSKWELFIPPELAYGERGTRRIGPNATLIFELELLAIKDQAEAGRQSIVSAE